MRQFVFAAAVALVATAGCAPAPPPLPPMTSVKGTVQLDRKPMTRGEIVFNLPGMPEQRIPVFDGAYSGDAMVGTNQVGVFSYIETEPDSGLSTDEVKQVNVVADRFSYRTTLKAELKVAKPDVPNEFNFEVSTR